MIGKKNIVFGFIYLILTASLGPYMVVQVLPDVEKAQLSKQEPVGFLQNLKETEYMEVDTIENHIRANTDGIVAINNVLNNQAIVDRLKSGPHAHGNLEAVLNILAGLVLCFIAVGKGFKQLISWVFILGAILHSGMLYLLNFQLMTSVAAMLLNIGPWLVLLGFLLIAIAVMKGFRPEVVKDD